MDMVDFLCKFFGLWYEDAIVLAAIFGYQDVDEAYSFEDSAKEYDEYLQSRVDAVNIMKSLVLDKEVDEIKKSIGSLSAKEYLQILKVQEVFEKNFEAVSTRLKKSSPSKEEGVTAAKAVISPSVEINKKEDSMSEFISKAAYEAELAKAVEAATGELKVELQKARDEIAKHKEEKQEAVSKARKAVIADVEKDEAAAEELYKSLESASDELFDSMIKVLKKKAGQLEESDLLKELGGKGDEVVHDTPNTQEDTTAKLLKAKFDKGAQ
jgi:superfamily II DNA helicase RecQ